MYEYSAQNQESRDELFFERLDTFMDKCLADIRAFSERELRPYEETRRHIAEWHAKYLFKQSPQAPSLVDRPAKVKSVLCDASRILESLCETAGVQSFLLAVDPFDASDAGFLGGSVMGREFWRGMRGGGEAGARTFKSQFVKHQPQPSLQPPRTESLPSTSSAQTIASPSKITPAKSLKLELNDAIRKALRSSSGIRNAEMKWTNPERLDLYGVRLVGWPPEIPAQNPSSLKAIQNKQLLQALQNGTMRFEKTMMVGREDRVSPYSQDSGMTQEAEKDEDFSWAYDPDALDDSIQAPSMTQSSCPAAAAPSSDDLNTWIDASALDTYGTSYSWSEAHSSNYLGADMSDLGRARKRQRSEEAGSCSDRPSTPS
ncbi:hypothetical protein BDQ17DRAFT_1541630 [Cyathus striatus]|nr:hypothetical protein BDQ17DRAFT_1541630 [Cyathus striatus]